MRVLDYGKVAMGAMLAVSLAGCGGYRMNSLTPWSGPVERTTTLPADATVYACANGKQLVVRPLAGSSSVMIVFREREFRLDATPGAPGRYSNGATTLSSNDDQTSLAEEGALTYSNCRRAGG
jgi:hypothetical protein